MFPLCFDCLKSLSTSSPSFSSNAWAKTFIQPEIVWPRSPCTRFYCLAWRLRRSGLLVVVNKTTSTVASETLELKFCSTNWENAWNVMSENGLWSGAADATGKYPIRRMIDHREASRPPIVRIVIQMIKQGIWRKCLSRFSNSWNWLIELQIVHLSSETKITPQIATNITTY